MGSSFFSSFRKDFRLYFLRKRVDYEKAVKYYFIEKDVAYIACKVSGLDDIVSHYSVPGYELLNEDFCNYLERIMIHIPEKYPLVLEITGHQFTKDEQTRIEDAIWTQFELQFGAVQKKQRSGIIRAVWFVIFLALSAFLLLNTRQMLYEMVYILFWFFGDRLIEYLILDEFAISREKMHYAQILSMKVIFTDKYSDEDISDNDADSYRGDIIKNIMDNEV